MFRGRAIAYLGLALGLVAARFALGGLEWTSGVDLHTLQELASTILALIVAGVAMARFYAKKTSMFLFIGCSFLGAGLLDGYHTFITSQWFHQYWPSDLSNLIPWSGNVSRIYLGVLLLLSYWIGRKKKPMDATVSVEGKFVIFGIALLILVLFGFFYLTTLPSAYFTELFLGRPQDLVVAVLFLFALIGFLREGGWRRDPFKHWLVISLFLGFAGQALFMPFSFRLFDPMFDLAHLLKLGSYLCVLTGLFLSMFDLFVQAEGGKSELARINDSLQRESEQRRQAEAEVRQLNVGLAESVSERTAKLEKVLLDLQTQEAQVRATLDTAVVGIITITEFGIVESLNQTACEIFGYAREEVVGRNLKMLMPEEEHSRHEQGLQRYRKTGQKKIIGIGIEVMAKRKNAEIFHMSLAVSEVNISGRRVFNGIVQDITERKIAEERIREQETRLRTILDTAGEGIISFDKALRILSFNPAAHRIFGYEEGQAEGKNISLLVAKSDRAYYFKHLKYYLVKGRKTLPGKPREILGLRKDGSFFPIEVTVDAVRINGDYLFIGMVRDITDRKNAESALEETRNRLELAMRGSNLGIWDVNLKTREATYDERWANMLGYKLEEIEQTADFFDSLCHPDDIQSATEVWLQYKRGERQYYNAELRLRTKDGGWKWILTHGQFVEFDEDGNPIRAVGIHQDITERKEAEEAIRGSEERYRSLFENSPIPHWEEDFSAIKDYIDSLRSAGVSDFREYFKNHPESVNLCSDMLKILNVNQATVKLFKGQDKTDFIHFAEISLSNEVYHVLREELIALCEGKTVFESELRGKDMEGNPYHVILTLFVIPGFEDTWSKVVITNVDILGLREAEEQAARLGYILEESLNEIYIINALGLKFVQVNRGARENLHYNSEELAELTPLDIEPGFTLASFEEMIRPLRSGETERVHFSTVHKRRDGSTYPVEAYLQMSTYGFDAVFVAIVEDVTEKKIAERELRDNEARLSTILNTVADGIVVFDQSKRIQIFNPAAENMFGYSSKEIIDADFCSIITEEYVSKCEELFIRLFKYGESELEGTPQEAVGLRKDGSSFSMEITISVAEVDGQTRVIALVRDITERKKIQLELENHRQNLKYTVEARTAELRQSMERLIDANLRLEEANKHRSRFISSMSHELRTPLSAILGFADLYKKNYGPTADERQNTYIDNIFDAGKHLLNLINNILDLAKIDSGKMEIELDVFPPGDFIEGILKIMSAQFKEKDLKVEAFIDPYLRGCPKNIKIL